jgi:ABC-2 type transport system ATP-binding protein
MSDLAIEAHGLTKRYGDTVALAGVDMAAERGTVLGVLGPNGAGKSTTVRILTTLARPDEGRATVAGFDVVTQGDEVRRHIGVSAQDATVDIALTGRQNLVMIGELSRLDRVSAQRRAVDLLERFGLTDAADRVVKGYSGGMRRRLDLAASIVTSPPILFLDEPTTGLDPTSRAGMWDIIRTLVDDGVTVLLTTQYLDEADQLADRISVVDHGRVIAEGTPSELKATAGQRRLVVRLSDARPGAVDALRPFTTATPTSTDGGQTYSFSVEDAPGLASAVVTALGDIGAGVDEVAIHQPSLDDVFFSLTGHGAGGDDQDDPIAEAS